jgi:hypothetical protein
MRPIRNPVVTKDAGVHILQLICEFGEFDFVLGE